MTRWRRLRVPLLLVALLVLVPGLAVLVTGVRGSGALDPASPEPGGSRAVAQVLGDAGVPVTRVERVAAASQELQEAGGDATLVVARPDVLDPERLDVLADAAGDVVLLAPGEDALEAVVPQVQLAEPQDGSDGPGAEGATPDADADPVRAGCDDPDAVAAGTAPGGGLPLEASSGDATVCFDGSYAVVRTPGRTVRVLAQPAVVTNEALGSDGTAALALRSLGARPQVVWLMASPLDADAAVPDATVADLLPPWVGPVAAQLVLAALAAVAWRARRLGRLVREPLPVVVRSTETARGRAALYRASGESAAPAAALRAAARWRLAARLGLPPSAPAAQVAALAARATGRPLAEVERLLLGPAPADDRALVALATDLDALEDLAHSPSPRSTP